MDDEPDDDLPGAMIAVDPDDMPSLETEDGRDAWAAVLASQDDTTLEAAGMDWIKALVIQEGDRMVVRFVYEDGSGEVLDLTVNRTLAVETPEGERN